MLAANIARINILRVVVLFASCILLSSLGCCRLVVKFKFDLHFEREKDFFNAVWLHGHNVLDLLLAQVEAQFLENFVIQGVPVVGLLGDRVRLTVVVHLHHLRDEVPHDLRDEHSVREVSRNAPLGSAQRDLIDPIVNHLQVVF